MERLSNDEDLEVQALAAARLGQKAVEETPAIACYLLPICRGKIRRSITLVPIPLRYSAAHTHRLGGDWKMNMQNLPSGRGGKVTKLRKALIAPPGHKVVVADLGQIEARLTAWLCGQEGLPSCPQGRNGSVRASSVRHFQPGW